MCKRAEFNSPKTRYISMPSATESTIKRLPSIDETISLRFPVVSRSSPDCVKVAYTVRTTNWAENRYEHQCYVYDVHKEESHQLTRSGNVTDVQWVDNDSLAVLMENTSKEEKLQVWLFENLIGEGLQVTDHENGVQSFRVFSDGVLYVSDDPEKLQRKERSDHYGNFTHFEKEESASALYYTDIQLMKEYHEIVKGEKQEDPVKPIIELSKLLPGPLKILSVYPSPKGDALYINCRSKDYLVYYMETSSFQLKLDPAKALEAHLERDQEEDLSYLGELTKINLPEGAFVSGVSPDGVKLLIRHKERDNKSYTQVDFWTLSLDELGDALESGDLDVHMINVTRDLDRGATAVAWLEEGIYLSYSDGTVSSIARASEQGELEVLDLRGVYPVRVVDVSEGGYLTYVGTNAEDFPEVYVSSEPLSSSAWELRKLTSLGEQVEGWEMGTVETIRWRSRDDTEIEGVLRKPALFDPNRKYPLVFVVHGGPSASSKEYLLEGYDYARYPVVQLVNRDVLVLKPNYRGSTGRGQAFLELNVDNLGVGDLWDLESGIDHLAEQGVVDEAKVGCMGWSQGGYISAMATTHSDRFCAVSVGAGVSDWYTYHIANDIPYFTTNYLSASPFRDRTTYMKTSPMTKIKEAKTPTLIQHGARDQRVPFTNATELYRGLKEMGVPTELYVFPEMAHPITKPRECRATMQQNLAWFSHYILGEELKLPE